MAATEQKVDAALARLDAFRESLADREALRQQVRAELEEQGVHWPYEFPACVKTDEPLVGKTAAR